MNSFLLYALREAIANEPAILQELSKLVEEETAKLAMDLDSSDQAPAPQPTPAAAPALPAVTIGTNVKVH